MIVVHAAWAGDGLLLWGETHRDRKKRGRARKDGILDFPFDAGAKDLTEVLEQAGVLTPFPDLKPLKAWAFFPSFAGSPPQAIPSTPLFVDNDEESERNQGEKALVAWQISALLLPPSRSLAFLSRISGRSLIYRGLRAGRDLSFWAEALSFTGSLVVRRSYLPAISEEGLAHRAVWEPLLTPADLKQCTALAGNMPHCARAIMLKKSGEPPADHPATVLQRFIAAHLDALVRMSMGKGERKTSFSVHDAWLMALRVPDSLLKVDFAEGRKLRDAVESWKRPVSVISDSPYRLAFRLEEPSAGSDTWNLRYLLQSCREESLFLEVGDLWEGGSAASLHCAAEGFDCRNYLLSAFGEAARLSPSVQHSLSGDRPSGAGLTTAEAYRFLVDEAPQCAERGFVLLLPSWWTGKAAALRISASVQSGTKKMESIGKLSLNDLVDFQWEIALGDKVLDRQELERLAGLKVPLVRVRGQWVSLGAEDIAQALALLEKKTPQRVRDVLQISLAGGRTPAGLEIGEIKISGYLEKLAAELHNDRTLVEQSEPSGFVGALRPYQKKGLSWLSFLRTWGLGACLADDMGLGKTVQTLALIQHERLEGETRPVLLVCPTSVVTNWRNEAHRFTPELPVMVHHGAGRAKGDSFSDDALRHGLVISTYALIHRDREHLEKVPWAGLVLDEAQNIKNAATLQAQAARAISADYRIALTGTPVENSLGDLWSLMEFLNPGYLGKEAEFQRTFLVPIQVLHDKGARERLRRITAPLILRRLKTDRTIIADLPEKIEMKEFCSLTKEQATLYSAALKEIDSDIEGSKGIERRGRVLGLISRLKQICNHPALFLKDNSRLPLRSGKLSRLSEMLEETVSEGDSSLIFTQFAEMGALLKEYLQDYFGEEVLFLHGAVSKEKRDAMVTRFQQAEKAPPFFVLSLKAGGTGLNLTRASHVFHFDRWWNPAVENQATDRAYRIGQERNVQVHKFVCAGTLEDRIDEMMEQKRELAESIIGTGESWLTELSTGELREVLKLRKSAM